MSKNPILNALAAVLYIVAVAGIMFYGLQSLKINNTILIPITIISLFTLSAAMMGYIFLYNPIQLYFVDNQKATATKLFLQTVGAFATILVIFLLTLFLVF